MGDLCRATLWQNTSCKNAPLNLAHVGLDGLSADERHDAEVEHPAEPRAQEDPLDPGKGLGGDKVGAVPDVPVAAADAAADRLGERRSARQPEGPRDKGKDDMRGNGGEDTEEVDKEGHNVERTEGDRPPRGEAGVSGGLLGGSQEETDTVTDRVRGVVVVLVVFGHCDVLAADSIAPAGRRRPRKVAKCR